MKPLYEVSDVLQRNTGHLHQFVRNGWQLRTINALSVCRTPALGGHIDICSNPECHRLHISYNSCRNRHCPKCQGEKREQWIEARQKELFRAPYYHIVFTLPAELNLQCMHHSPQVYNLLFKIAWSVIRDFAGNRKFLGAKTGMISILHTWGQNLSLHPHLHCIVPGGGLTESNKWKPVRGKGRYMYPVKAMGRVFRARFVEAIRTGLKYDNIDYRALFEKPWVVYCKKPFWGPEQVIEYLGRYTHKIAISNHRIKNIDHRSVTFSAKDYRKGGKKHLVTLPDGEFIRRFCLHILPKGFTRIRHYGILSSALKKICISILQDRLGKPELKQEVKHKSGSCFFCGRGELITLLRFDNRGPPSRETVQYLIDIYFASQPA